MRIPTGGRLVLTLYGSYTKNGERLGERRTVRSRSYNWTRWKPEGNVKNTKVKVKTEERHTATSRQTHTEFWIGRD